MTFTLLNRAGWLAMFSAFIAIPFSFLTFKLDGSADAATVSLQVTMQLFGTLLFIVLTRLMKRLLNLQYTFYGADRQINLMIMANIGAGILVIAGTLLPSLKETLAVAAMVVMVFLGIVQIQFGYRLMKLQDDLNGMLKPFCYSNMVTGVFIASVVLILVAVVTSAISDLMLATIFFNLAKQAKPPEGE